ncbi:MAG: enoyl-CoA hydratase/isomerase family protein [Acidobacteria bacterium]|nr:enoyl-CoA hydratase/isomerase family protein [Acidobacteriota bacterium]
MNGIRLSFESLEASPQLQVARITLARPPLNILDIPAILELSQAIVEAEERPEVRAVVLAAEGEKAFSVGVEVRDHTAERVGEMLGAFHQVFRVLARTEKITLAAVRGFCLGGGCELATFCDLVVAADNAQFGQPEIQLACFPPVAAITFPRLIGEKKAAELLLTGKRIGAAEAAALGLVNRVTPAAELETAVGQLLRELFQNSAAALCLAKRALRLGSAEDFDRRLEAVERLYVEELMRTRDCQEGILAFLEKRPPAWSHS